MRSTRFSGRKDLGLTGGELSRLFFIISSQAIEGRSCLIVIDRDRKTAAPPRLLAQHRGAFARGHVDQTAPMNRPCASKSGVGNGTKFNRVSHRTLVVRKECAIFGV